MIEFWFDFSSAYAFFAAAEIDDLAARTGRGLLWRPYMLGTAFKATGARGLSATPLKGDYARRDWARLARLKGLEFRLPPGHPKVALAATRAFYWIEDQAPDLAPAFARLVFRRYYTEGLDTSDLAAVAPLGAGLGLDPGALAAGAALPAIKERAKAISEEAVARGIFGSPFFIADGEPFWGHDRLPMVEDWLRRGGW
ncbi:2-hydroxychromene-2-carboxylate isomerase [Zavarzinia compransoris]|uniref:2-hydroxychromene-2-carboxylate isomerase n=1 Tax=Zavarzinia compransoris TaxID=1264899 RepID=A0A317EA82_9PROT|nr:2-hydroxychromene-2-carboxylate isomerase [Zavarzinia compransoris]PWR23194.1 2-hydroxychromene-2-carboxylate isomerase [Zavarzinia compransoris]TDP46247.1 2-hydroxychromene-2-carboxylate isomerase [Zavarzinia compransoris]